MQTGDRPRENRSPARDFFQLPRASRTTEGVCWSARLPRKRHAPPLRGLRADAHGILPPIPGPRVGKAPRLAVASSALPRPMNHSLHP